jgi:hypothetical protein
VSPRWRLLLLACLPGAGAACFQQVDSGAASDPADRAGDDASASPADDLDASSWELCASPSCDDPSGTIPFMEQTPVIYLPDGASTADPCVQVESASMAVRQTYCASCHGPSTGSGQGGFNYVLDDTSLTTNMTTNATFTRFVVPGDPYSSYVYVSIANGTMPPAAIPGGPAVPVPTAADVSVLYGWIQACFAGADAGYANGGGLYGPGYEDAGEGGTDLPVDAAAPATDAGDP